MKLAPRHELDTLGQHVLLRSRWEHEPLAALLTWATAVDDVRHTGLVETGSIDNTLTLASVRSIRSYPSLRLLGESAATSEVITLTVLLLPAGEATHIARRSLA